MEKGRSRTLNVVPKTLHARHVLLQDGELSSREMQKSLSSTQWSAALTTIIEGEKSEHKDQDDTLHISQFLVLPCATTYILSWDLSFLIFTLFRGCPAFSGDLFTAKQGASQGHLCPRVSDFDNFCVETRAVSWITMQKISCFSSCDWGYIQLKEINFSLDTLWGTYIYMRGIDNVNDEKVEELTSVLPACSRKVSRQKSRAVTFDLEEKETSAGELEESSTLPLEIPRRKEYWNWIKYLEFYIASKEIWAALKHEMIPNIEATACHVVTVR